MRLPLLLVFLACAPPQDGDVGRLVEQLSHEDVAVRQEAAKQLLEIGEPARAALERGAKGADLELRERARSILTALDQAAVRRKQLGPGWTVTLAGGDYALGDLPGLLKNQIPVPLNIPEKLASSRVHLEAKGISAWSFLDRLCEAHGGLAVPLDRPKDALAVVEGRPLKAPTVYSGPFRLWIDKITLESRDPYGTPWQGAGMVLAIGWQPNVHPLQDMMHLTPNFGFRVAELTGEDGASLRGEGALDALEYGFVLDRNREGVWRQHVKFLFPPAKMRRLNCVRGTATLVFPFGEELLEFKKPLESSGKTVRAGTCSVTLASCAQTPKGIVTVLRFSRPERGGEKVQRQGSVGLRTRVQDESVVMVAGDGKESRFSVRSSSHSSGGPEETLELSGYFDLQGDMETLRVPFVADFFEHEVPFEFRNIELP